MLKFLYLVFLTLYLDFWVLGGSKTQLGWSKSEIKLLRVGLYLKNKYFYLDSKDRGCLTCCIYWNPFSGLNFQVETWRMDVGTRLASNYYKFFVFIVLTSLYLFFIFYTCLSIFCVWFYFHYKSTHSIHHLSTLLKSINLKNFKKTQFTPSLWLHIWATSGIRAWYSSPCLI